MQTWWLTGKEGYNFTLKLDVCVFVPKKVKLDRVVVKRDKKNSDTNLAKRSKAENHSKESNDKHEAKGPDNEDSQLANGNLVRSRAGSMAGQS